MHFEVLLVPCMCKTLRLGAIFDNNASIDSQLEQFLYQHDVKRLNCSLSNAVVMSGIIYCSCRDMYVCVFIHLVKYEASVKVTLSVACT